MNEIFILMDDSGKLNKNENSCIFGGLFFYSSKEYMNFINKYKSIIKKEIDSCVQKISEIKESYQKIYDYKVIARGIIYPGTQINIGPYTYNVLGNIGFSKFLICSGELMCQPLTPADRNK